MGALLASFTEGDEEVGVVRVAPCAHARMWFWAAILVEVRRGLKRVRLSRKKPPASQAFQGVLGDQPRPSVWKKLRIGVSPLGSVDDAGRRQLHNHLVGWGTCPGQGWDWKNATGAAQTHASRFAWVFN